MNAPPDIPDHELLRLIGRGAYGEVWLARNVMGIMRAVKVVRRSSFENERPFEREFAAVKRYEPVSRKAAGLVNVLHAGRAADGAHFHYVMELADCAVPGVEAALEPDKYVPCTLRTQIGRMGRMPVAECQEVAVSLANGIADLHRLGLVHRDVKPSNIIFAGGRAKLADIGLVGDISESRSYVGTEGYVPPEGPGQPGADLYSLGRVLYEMATGYEATRFPALPAEWAQQANAGAFEFYEIVLRCCEPNAERRYETAEELLADLALLQSGQSVRQVRQLKGRIAFLKRTALVAAGAGVLAAGFAWWQGGLVQRAEKAEAEARANLFAGLVQHAHNARLSGAHDARFTALELLERAAALHPGEKEVREEFIAALATPGLRRLSGLDAGRTAGIYDRTLTYRLTTDENYQLLLHRLSDGRLAGQWKEPGAAWVLPVGVSDDARTVFARDDRGRLLSWRDGQEQPPLTAEGSGDCHWSLTADAARAVAWRQDGSVSVVDIKSPAEHHDWKITAGFRHGTDTGPALAADGRRAAFAAAGTAVVVVSALPDGQRLKELTSPRALSAALAMSADGSVVAAGFQDGGIGIWRLDGTAVCEVIEAGYSVINALALTPDGRFLLSSCWTGATALWDLADGTRAARVPGPCSAAAFSADGTRLAVDGGLRMALYQWSDAPVCRALVLPRAAIHSQTGLYSAFTFRPQSPSLILPAAGGVLLVDAAAGRIVGQGPGGAVEAQCTADGHWLYLTGSTCVRIPLSENGGAWPGGTPQVLATSTSGGDYTWVRASRDGSVAAVRGPDLAWQIFRDGQPAQSLPCDADYSDNMSLSPDGALLATALRAGGVHVRRTDATGPVRAIKCSGSWPAALFSPDGSALLLSESRGLRLLHAATHEEIWHHDAAANGDLGRPVAFDPAGAVITGSWQPGTLTMLSAATGAEIVTLRRERENQAACTALSRDGAMLWESDATTQTLLRWDLHTLRTFLRARGLDWTDAPLPPPLTEM